MLNDDRIHVLIAHDNPLVAAGLEATLGTQQDFCIVGRRETMMCRPSTLTRLPLRTTREALDGLRLNAGAVAGC